MLTSASRHILLITRTASTGKAPAAVSPRASRNGRCRRGRRGDVGSLGLGFFTIDSSICVAVTTGLPAVALLDHELARESLLGRDLHPEVAAATITPSLSSRMSSKLTRPSWFSTLEMILMDLPSSPRTS